MDNSPGRGPATANRPAAGAAKDSQRFGRALTYHGEVATLLESAQTALSTPVDNGWETIPFDEHEVTRTVVEVANRVHRHTPDATTGAVYSPTTRDLAVRVANFTRLDPGTGTVVPDVVLRDDDGVARWVRPEVASLLTGTRKDLRANPALREAAQVEAQRRIARAALADGLR